MGKSLIVSCLLFFALSTQANTQDPYYEISEVKVEVLSSSQGFEFTEPDPGPQVGDVIKIFREIIAFGKEVYKIVEKGKPVINTKYAPISVLPLNTRYGKDITSLDLSQWKRPKFVKFKVSYINGYGSEVVAFTYNVNMSYGGNFEGKGSYIANAQIVPEVITVAWGYTFNASMSLVGLTNIGTEDEPIAGATLQLSYSVATIVKEERKNMTIFIAGDGTIQQM